MEKYDGSGLLAKQQIYAKDENGRMRAVGADFPMKVEVVNGSESPGPSSPVNILGAGAVAGSAFYPASGTVTKEIDITVFFGASNQVTQANFNSYVVDINGRQTVLPGLRENISIAQVNSAAVGDIVNYTIPVGCRLKFEYTTPTGGGTLNIKGVV